MCTAHLIRLAVRRAMLAVTRSQTQGLNAIHRVAWSVSLNIAFAGTALAADLPTGGSITSGAGNISQSADALTINQSSSRLNIDW